jgi:hypothetical protein
VKLGFTPEEPLLEHEKYKHKANYPTTQASMHILLDGEDAAQNVPSGYLLFILNNLLDGIPQLLRGQSVTAQWFNEPWQWDIRGFPQQNRIVMTLHVQEQWVAMRGVTVPLDLFGKELLQLGREWLKHLKITYPIEVADPILGQKFRQLQEQLITAEQALARY